LKDPFTAGAVSERLQRSVGVSVVTWYQEQKAFFAALRIEKAMMAIVLGFVTLVAVFSITSSLIMKIIQKRRDVGILRTLGVSANSVQLLFILEGILIGAGGTVIGVVLGTLLAVNITPVAFFLGHIMGVDLLNSQFVIDAQVPVELDPWSIAWIAVAALVLTALSTIYPAWKASQLDPIDALRHE
jgi:lipoprotein-releasing system permease protein